MTASALSTICPPYHHRWVWLSEMLLTSIMCSSNGGATHDVHLVLASILLLASSQKPPGFHLASTLLTCHPPRPPCPPIWIVSLDHGFHLASARCTVRRQEAASCRTVPETIQASSTPIGVAVFFKVMAR